MPDYKKLYEIQFQVNKDLMRALVNKKLIHFPIDLFNPIEYFPHAIYKLPKYKKYAKTPCYSCKHYSPTTPPLPAFKKLKHIASYSFNHRKD